MPRVFNRWLDQDIPAEAVYVGRPSKWGNPYRPTRDDDESRSHAIHLYEIWLHSSGRIRQLHELVGKDLVCYCAPLACHADVLLRLANDPN